MQFWIDSILGSYGQLFFSHKKGFSILLLISSFIDPKIGLAGFVALMIGLFLAKGLGYSQEYTRSGLYTFNVLMAGLALGVYYEWSWSFLIILSIAAILCFFLNLWILNKTSVQHLPLLSWSFIIVVWIVLFGGSNFSAFHLPFRDYSNLNTGGMDWIMDLQAAMQFDLLPDFVLLYLKSLGAIMFQFQPVAGLLIFIGLLLHSRISSMLSIFGFALGIIFYRSFEGDFEVLLFIGFNFILTAIALGGFFLVPSKKSFLLVGLIIPVIGILISGLHTSLNAQLGFPLFSLPFCIVVTIVLKALMYRVKDNGLQFVKYQFFSPEQNHFKNYFAQKRFGHQKPFNFQLPVLGSWRISQGYDGGITHKGEWGAALDFDIVGSEGETYQNGGADLVDYFCYNIPVLAPGWGTVVEVIDGIEDNKIGDSNLEQNWGNTIVIKHADFLYSKLSHIKKGTFEVAIGDYVEKGKVIAKCGSSGRSPEPHLHFQFQATPFVGSKTLAYPIGDYLVRKGRQLDLQNFTIPKEGEEVLNIQPLALIKDAFTWQPGESFELKTDQKTTKIEVVVDAYNQTYFWDEQTGAVAYYVLSDHLFYCTSYSGDQGSLLFDFYLAFQKCILGAYEGLNLKEPINTNEVLRGVKSVLLDCTAPFYHIFKAEYCGSWSNINHPHNPTSLTWVVNINAGWFGNLKNHSTYRVQIDETGISKIQRTIQNKTVTILCD